MANETISGLDTMSGGEKTLLAGRYRPVKALGQGGMGSVWLAEDTALDNHQVALKLLPPILVSNRRALQQLKAEALVSLKLTHPNIAALRSPAKSRRRSRASRASSRPGRSSTCRPSS